MERADAIIAVTESTRQEIIATFGLNPAKIVAIHNGVGSQFRPLSQAETAAVLHSHRLTHKGYILNVGTLEPRKNLIRLARAYRSLPTTLRERYPLVIVGMKGWHYESIEQELGPLLRSGHARLPGYIPAEALPAIYAGAAMLVYPSLYEGFGLPLVEAMASGTPVITSNRSSMPEVVGNAGILVEPEDETMIAEAIRQLLEDKNAAQRLQQQGLEQPDNSPGNAARSKPWPSIGKFYSPPGPRRHEGRPYVQSLPAASRRHRVDDTNAVRRVERPDRAIDFGIVTAGTGQEGMD